MTDTALHNAEKTRDSLARKINELNQELDISRRALAKVENFIGEWHRFAGTESVADEGEVVLTGVNSVDNPRLRVGVIKNPDRAEVGRVALEIIEQQQKPIPRKELFQALADRGIHIRGKDPEMVLSTMLWRMGDKFVRINGYGYWPIDKPYVPANYQPSDLVAPEDNARSPEGGLPFQDS